MDTSVPYTGAIRGTVHKPQANLGADQKFSLDRLKTRKGGLGKNLGNKKKGKNNQEHIYQGFGPKIRTIKVFSQDLK